MREYKVRIVKKDHGTYTFEIEELQAYEDGDEWIGIAQFLFHTDDEEAVTEAAISVIKSSARVVASFTL
jgi:hypothetical protein